METQSAFLIVRSTSVLAGGPRRCRPQADIPRDRGARSGLSGVNLKDEAEALPRASPESADNFLIEKGWPYSDAGRA